MERIFELIFEIADKTNATPIKDKVWSHKVDESWNFKVNGFTAVTESIPPFHIMVEYNGFPAGLIGFDGGVIAAGDAANEEAFVSALETNLATIVGG